MKLNLLIISLTTFLSNAREHVAKSGEIKRRTTKKTAEVQGNYPSLKKNELKKILSPQKSA